MNKLNLEKNDELLNLKKAKQSIYDEIVDDTKKHISFEETRAKKYIDTIVLPAIRNANKIGITIRRFSLNDITSNILTKPIVKQLQELGFVAFLKESNDSSEGYLYVTYSINEKDSISTTMALLQKEYKSALNVEDKLIEDFIHDNIKSKIKKANHLGQKDLKVELPIAFSNVQMTSIMLNSLINNKLDTKLRFTNKKPTLYINWREEFLKDSSVDIDSIIKNNIFYNYKNTFSNKENQNNNYKVTKKRIIEYKTNLARAIGDIFTAINTLIELEESTDFNFLLYTSRLENNFKESLNTLQNSCSNLISYINTQNLIIPDVLENIYIYAKLPLLSAIYYSIANKENINLSKDFKEIKDLTENLNELLLDAENIIDMIDYKIDNIHNFDVWKYLNETLPELHYNLTLLNGSFYKTSNEFIIDWIFRDSNFNAMTKNIYSNTNTTSQNNIKFTVEANSRIQKGYNNNHINKNKDDNFTKMIMTIIIIINVVIFIFSFIIILRNKL